MNVHIEMEQITRCPGCGSEYDPARKFWIKYLEGEAKLWYVPCERCKTYFQTRRIREDLLEEYYTRVYPQITAHEGDEAKETRKNRGSNIVKLYNSLHLARPRAVLDFGCSDGAGTVAIAEAFDNDPVVHGYDIARHDSGLIVSEWDALQDDAFDFLTMLHVLEHLYHPDQEFQRMLMKAKRGAIVAVEVPNPLAAPASFVLSHPVAYTPEGLKIFLERNGVQIINIFLHGLPLHPVTQFHITAFGRVL